MHLSGTNKGRGGGRWKRLKKNIICFLKNAFCVNEQLWKEASIIALIILFFCEFALCISVVVFPFSMRLKQSAHKTKKQRKDGRERGRGVRWPPHIEHFPVDFVEGFSAAWLNEQRHANEWRMNVIIYQTKSGGLWEMETEGGGEGGGRRSPYCWK